MTVLVGLAIRTSIILAAGLLLSACLRRRSAALRHRVLAGSLLAAALVMPLGATVPEWTLTLPAPAVDARPAGPIIGVTQALTVGAAAPDTATAARISPILLTWLGGALAVGGALIASVIRISHVARRATPIHDVEWLRILKAVAARYGVTRPIVIARTDSPDLLATSGMRRPHILLPRQSQGWTLDRVHVVFCHELAHIRRHDWFVQMAAETLRALLWFNPLVWITCRQLRRESEQACDDEVLGTGVGAREYAAHLIELVRQCRRSGSTWASGIPMAHPSALERRIAAMLNPRLDRRRPSPRVTAALAVVLLLVALPVAAVRARQAGPAPLTGTIYDVSGGVLPGVKVTLSDRNEVESVAITDATGRFLFPAVPAGSYRLSTELPGFRALRETVELRDAHDWDRLITLQVGDLVESIIVGGSRVGPATEPSATQPVRIGGNVRAPRKIKDVRPLYPAAMRDAGTAATVVLEAVIGRDGRVLAARVLNAQVHPDFAIAAADAVRQWQFTPTLLNGQPIEVMMTVTVRFDLSQ